MIDWDLDTLEDESYRLCYVGPGNIAHFAQGNFEELTRDGWHRTHYEYNSMSPYGDHEDIPVIEIEYWGNFAKPCDEQTNSPYSANDITMEKKAPWLKHPREGDPEDSVRIYAGTTLPEFVEQVQGTGGDILVPLEVVRE